MSKKNEAVEIIVKHKADKMKKGLSAGEDYNKHIKKVLRQLGINTSKEQVRAFVVGAVDAMIYDVGAALGFTKSYPKRKEMLKKIFPKGI